VIQPLVSITYSILAIETIRPFIPW